MKTIFHAILSLGMLTTAAVAGENPAVTDPQIAAIVVTANQVDIDAGKFAAKRATSSEVKAFAQTMVTDHTAVNESAVDLVTKLNVTPEESETSRALAAGGKDNLEKLSKLNGKAFERAYIDHEVAYHQQVIDAVDTLLIPNAQNAELKALLEKVRPALVQHLNHAKHLQTTYQ